MAKGHTSSLCEVALTVGTRYTVERLIARNTRNSGLCGVWKETGREQPDHNVVAARRGP